MVKSGGGMSEKSNIQSENRIYWIDVLKFISIFAVYIDHTYKVLYENQNFARIFYFSVSLFVFLGGITAYTSELKNLDLPYLKNFWRRSKTLLTAYILGTVSFTMMINGKFELRNIIIHLLNFTAYLPLYFVFFYIQLILISRLLACIIKEISMSNHIIIFNVLLFFTIIIISIISIKKTQLLDLYGGGNYLFGGTYLFLFYLGMMYSAYKDKINFSKRNYIFLFIASTILLILLSAFIYKKGFILDEKLHYNEGVNPPGPTQIIQALLIFVAGISFSEIINRYNFTLLKSIEKHISFLGRHTLYMFIFHFFMVYQYLLRFKVKTQNISFVLVAMILYASMIAIPILIEYIWNYLVYYLCHFINDLKHQNKEIS